MRIWWKATWSLIAGALLIVLGFSARNLLGCAALFGLGLLAYWAYNVSRLMGHRSMTRWAARNGWTRIDVDYREWAWTGLHVTGSSQVSFALQGVVDGLPVTTGEVEWDGGAFSGASLAGTGTGVFVIVRLPHRQPPMAMRLPFVTVGDSPRLENPQLRRAFLTGEIPAFTVRGDELFTIDANINATEPEAVQLAVNRALEIVRILDLGPDKPR
ncbi:hypothetical protein KOI35_23510 [Actinoplanes bogorensis]|uniref:Uncharacterized protein n=1 Tax=Paractinoplanes bogorensis TaxID=1610840 RepID=A0ABS5YSR0_9ACTN|nr:hypothetical protein [Actinoplanes bogorensis]MBU2666478.1 hypothetical protein [Actinoplanes bogorensis]